MVSYGTNPDYKSEADLCDDDLQHLLSRYLAAKGSEADPEGRGLAHPMPINRHTRSGIRMWHQFLGSSDGGR